MWADAGLYSRSGPWLLINQPFYWGAERRSLLEAEYLQRTSVHLLLNSLTFASPSARSRPFLLCNPATGRHVPLPSDVRDAWLPNIETDHKCPYVSVACISRKTVTHLISHNQKLQLDPRGRSSRDSFSVGQMMVVVEFSLLWFMRRLLLCPIFVPFISFLFILFFGPSGGGRATTAVL